MREYKRLTKKDWHEAKFSRVSEYEPSDRVVLKQLWELENKIENGTLVDLPCKVGDKFYQVVEGLPIYEWEVETIVFSNIYFPKNYVITARRTKDLAHWKFWSEDFGETWFLTKAEAENKLKELQNER